MKGDTVARNFIVLDTEGVDTVKHSDNNAHPETSLFYDLGFIVVDGNTGEELAAYSFINVDVFNDTELMKSAYFKDKINQYNADIDAGAREMRTTSEIYSIFHTVCAWYDVRDVWAYNAYYDMTITAHTVEVMSNGFIDDFIPSNVTWCDVWPYAGSTLCKTRKYAKWALTREYKTDSGNPSTRAEIVYKYLIKDDTFNEAHTALEDARIEAAILWNCKRRKQRARHSIGNGWRDVAKIADTL